MKTEAETKSWVTGIRSLPSRIIIPYTFFYMLPFPLGMLDVLGAVPGFEGSVFANALQYVVGLHAKLTGPVIQAIGSTLLGQDVSLEVNGSSDTLCSYLDVLLDGSLAIIVALFWFFKNRSESLFSDVVEVNRTLLRYYLFTVMMAYGIIKFVPGGQFITPGPDQLIQPFGDFSPMGLLWAFMGASKGYQIFSGAAEMLGGLLLLSRRTTLLGSLLSAAAMGNVFILNLCYDVPVKLFSFHLLFMSLVLAAPDASRLIALFVTGKDVAARRQPPLWKDSPRFTRVAHALKLIFLLLFVKQYVGMAMNSLEKQQSRLANPLRGIYSVQSFEIKDSPEQKPPGSGKLKRWVRVGMTPPWSLSALCEDGTFSRWRTRWDQDGSGLTISERGIPEPKENLMRSQSLPDGMLRVEGEFEGREIAVTLKKEEKETVLTGRGFRWISEEPFLR